MSDENELNMILDIPVGVSAEVGSTHLTVREVLAWRHLGLYGYRVEALRAISAAEPCELEVEERLEQLRALWMGMEIRIGVDTVSAAPDVDTPEDLQAVENILSNQSRA